MHPIRKSPSNSNLTYTMLTWTITFLVIAVIAAVLGFGALAGIAGTIAKVCFVIFLALFVISLITGRRPAV